MTPFKASLIPVSDLDDERVAPYRDQRDQWIRARHRHWMDGNEAPSDATGTGMDPGVDPGGDLFIAEGDKVIDQLLLSGHETISVLVAEHRVDVHAGVLERVPAGVPIYVANRKTIDKLAGFAIHRGLMAVGRRTPPLALPELLGASALCVVCEDLANHDNVGGIFRSVRALAPRTPGYRYPACVLFSPKCCDPLYRKALRVSMGNALHVPWATIEPWPDALEQVTEAGFELIALDPGKGARDIAAEGAGSRRVALVLGTEGDGLSLGCIERVRAVGGYLGKVPIEPASDSLNVGVACAVALDRVRSRTFEP